MSSSKTTKEEPKKGDDDDVVMTDSNNPNTAAETKPNDEVKVVVMPPLQAAAWRLEKVLSSSSSGGGLSLTNSTTTTTNNGNNGNNGNSNNGNQLLLLFANPAKQVRRWLSTSSGIAAQATLRDIRLAAHALFPQQQEQQEASSAKQYPLVPLLWKREPEEEKEEDASTGMEEEEGKEEAAAVGQDKDSSNRTLHHAALEVQVWLLSLKIRLLWRKGGAADAALSDTAAAAAASIRLNCWDKALELARVGIEFVTESVHSAGHPETDGTTTVRVASSTCSLFPLLARLWRFYVLIALDDRRPSSPTPNLRAALAQAHNAALLRRDLDTASTLLNGMLRELLQHKQVEQAQKLLSNSTFPSLPDSSSSTAAGGGTSTTNATSTATSVLYTNNNQLCRYLYYSGRIQALRLEYTNAYANLTQSLRKAPTQTALGFRITVQRLLIVVQLLMGEIPERSVFSFSTTVTTTVAAAASSTTTTGTTPDKDRKTTTTVTTTRRQSVPELEPYLHLTQAVRKGDLAVFHAVLEQYKSRFQRDETWTLISRLAHQVVKAGLRKLQSCYLRLSLVEIAQRLGLQNTNTSSNASSSHITSQAEYVVMKAIRDGVLMDAVIVRHPTSALASYVQFHHAATATLVPGGDGDNDNSDVVATALVVSKEPAFAFHRRIAYCLTTHNDAVRAMRYPPDAYKHQLEASRSGSARARRKNNDDKTDEEKAQELEDELDEDY